jgi:hypothetical protein
MKVEIEIPDPPEGWVVGGFRRANKGERWWDGVRWHDCKYPTSGRYLVCVKAKPLWEPPPELVAVLRTGWIARDPGGWYWYTSKPKKDSKMWLGQNKPLHAIKQNLLPDSIPWDKSLFKIGDPKE